MATEGGSVMAVSSLDQIYKSLGSIYNPQTNLIRQQQADIPTSIAAEEKGLQAKQEQSFGDILNGARQRGMGFSGIPLAEQAKYTSTEFLPALARLKQTGRQQATTLEQSLLDINERRRGFAQQIRDGDLQRDLALRQMRQQQKQFEAELRQRQAEAARAGSGGGGGGIIMPTLGGGSAPKAPKPLMQRKKDGGYSFKDPQGRPISAAAYSLGTGIPFRQLLQQMANKGDKGARRALGFVGDDYGFDSARIGKNQGLFNSLTWGIK